VPTNVQEGLDNLAIEKMRISLPTPAHEVYVNVTAGSDVTGDGSLGNPYQTITQACTIVDLLNPDANNPYIINVMSSRDQIEPGDISLPPWTWIVGKSQYACFIDIAGGGGSLRPTSSWGNFVAYGGMINCRVNGNIQFDLNAIGGGSPFSGLQMDNVYFNGTMEMSGRNGDIDTFEAYNFTLESKANIDSVRCTISGSTFLNQFSLTSNKSSSDSTFKNSNFINVSLNDTGFSIAVNAFRCYIPGSLNLNNPGVIYSGDEISWPLLPNLSVGGGSSIVRLKDVTGLAFNPTNPGDWSIVPTTTQEAIDNLATNVAGAVSISNSIINAIIFG
jgi:hypothetical protein